MTEELVDPSIAEILSKLKLLYEEALETRRRSEIRVATLHAAITALEAAGATEPLHFSGTLADACRLVLRTSNKSLSPTEVRDGVVGLGFSLSSLKHDNPMASIHSVLKRLVDANDAETETTADGTRYRWTGRAQTERSFLKLSDLILPDFGKSESIANLWDYYRQALEANPEPPPGPQRRRLSAAPDGPPTMADSIKALRRRALIDKMTEKK